MTIIWTPPDGPICLKCATPIKYEGASCPSCPSPSYENDLITKEQFKERLAIQRGLGYLIKKRFKKFL